MQESRLLGTLLPPSPALLSLVEHVREKYGPLEFSPDDDPIEEIFLHGELVPLEDFREGIRFLVQSAPERLPPLLA